MNPITREEYFLAKIAGEESPEIQPVTREEIFLAKAAGMDVPELEPVTRKEWFISQISSGGGGGGGGKNIQVAIAAAGTSSANSTPLTGVTLTVQKTGLYTCAWFAVRSGKSGTQGTQLYINGKAYGTESSSYDNPLYSVGKLVVLNSVQLNEGDVIRVYGRSTNSSYGALAGNLTIVEE